MLKIIICLILGGLVVPQENSQNDETKVQADAVGVPKPLPSAIDVDEARKAAEKKARESASLLRTAFGRVKWQDPYPNHTVYREIRKGDVVSVAQKPYRWTDRSYGNWDFRILYPSYEEMHNDKRRQEFDLRYGGTKNPGNELVELLKADLTAERSFKLHFGTVVRLLEIKRLSYDYRHTEYRVEILDGPLKGKVGWTEFKSLPFYVFEHPSVAEKPKG